MWRNCVVAPKKIGRYVEESCCTCGGIVLSIDNHSRSYPQVLVSYQQSYPQLEGVL